MHTVNGLSCSTPLNPTAAKIGETFAYCLIFVVSLLGNSFIAVIVYKTQSLRKPINFFVLNMAMSDLLFPVFLFPWELAYLYADSWLISGPLGQALCKLVSVLVYASNCVSIQSLVLIAVDRFRAVVFPLRSPLISSKLCPFCILATWIVAIAVFTPYFFAWKLTEYQGQLFCSRRWNEAFGESSSSANFLLAVCVVFLYITTVLLSILYSIILYTIILYSIILYSIILYSIILYSIILYSIILYSIILYSIILYSIILYSIILYSIILYSIILYSIILYSIILYSIILYSIILYSIILYSIILYSIILYSIILYSIILYSIILYSIILYSIILYSIILYSIILIKLKLQQIPGEQSTNAEQQRAKRNRSVLKMAIAIVFGFVVCWLPWSICDLLSSFALDSLSCGFFLFRNITWFLALSNCAVNPCICLMFGTNYRTALQRLFSCFRGAAQRE